MSIVVLTREGIEHRYVVDTLVRHFGDEITAIILDSPPTQPLRARIRRYRRRYTPRQLVSRLAVRVLRVVTRADARREETMQRILFPEGDPGPMPLAERTHVVSSHNDAAALELLDELKPDVIAVYGTLILRPPTIRKARLAILNMHTGISPRYRGSDTYFWPLYNEEPEWIGVTIHHLNEGIDSGDIISIGRPTITTDDNLATLFAKCVAVGAELYAAAVRAALDGTLTSARQDLSEGRNYLSVERTVAAELRVKRLLRRGLLRTHRLDDDGADR